MRILYIHQYFVTPDEAGGTRSYWFSRALIEAGYDVIVITSDTQRISKKLINKKIIDGIDVIYINVAYKNEMGIWARIWAFFKFMILSTIISLKQKDISLVYASSTPLTIGFPALLLNKIKKIPYIFEVRDLWPEFPIQMGAIKNPFTVKFLRWFEKSIYSHSKKIVALSPGMAEGIINCGISNDKVIVLTNMSKPDIFYPREKDKEIAGKYGIKDTTFNIIHFGAMGPANGLGYIIDTARLAKQNDINDICFIIVGNGYERKQLENSCISESLDNVIFIDKVSQVRISEIVNLCDVSVTSFKPLKILETNSPNKFFDSLSAGIPVIVNSAGWTRNIVEVYKCGYYVNPNSPQDFLQKILILKSNTELRQLMGSNARIISLEIFNKDVISSNFVKLIKNFQCSETDSKSQL